MLSYILLLGAAATSVSAQSVYPGVIATGTMGPTNPPQPTAGTPINQTSYSRLLTINSVDDWCLFAPPNEGAIADTETLEVAWCTKPRNNARLIPDGTITGVSFLKTDLYVQLMAYGDFTRLNIPAGDEGGELDPHGATGAGNPVGGNVTTNITGSDINIAEWMQYISYNQASRGFSHLSVCLRACTNANSTYSAAAECWHELDEMGCNFVMPGNYNFNGTFETCEADVAYPPGWYPEGVSGGTTSFSSFAQYYTGAYAVGSSSVDYTVGDTVTPSAPYSIPSSSNCATVSTISNGVALASLGVSGNAGSGSGAGPAPTGKSGSSPSRSGSGSSASSTGASGGSSNPNGAMGVARDMQLMGIAVGVVVAMISGVAVLL
ncbi:hypothetical protein B0H21DRAFT_693433 [Amylocystis lapponica]|nr:hypothetical protein B0H21DRAFT_693433 [Amylocystis lapponica]